MTNKFAIIFDENKTFKCCAKFAFDPLICVSAAPKIENIFLGKGIEKCKKIAKDLKFIFVEIDLDKHN